MMQPPPPPVQHVGMPHGNPSPHNMHPIVNQHQVVNHGRSHVNTPPHSYGNASRQGPPPASMMNHNGPKVQINGEGKPPTQRPPRNTYVSQNMGIPQHPQQSFQEPPKQDVSNCVQPRHREETKVSNATSKFVVSVNNLM